MGPEGGPPIKFYRMDKLPSEVESTLDIWKRFGQLGVHYAFWFFSCALGLLLVFLLRWNLIEALFALRVNPWQLRAFDKWSIYALGMVWIVGSILIEGYLRRSLFRGRLHVAAGRVLAVQLGLIALSFAIYYF